MGKPFGNESSDEDDFVSIVQPHRKRKSDNSPILEKMEQENSKESKLKRSDILKKNKAFDHRPATRTTTPPKLNNDDDDFISSVKKKKKDTTNKKQRVDNVTNTPRLTIMNSGIGIVPLQNVDDECSTETSCSSSDENFVNKMSTSQKIQKCENNSPNKSTETLEIKKIDCSGKINSPSGQVNPTNSSNGNTQKIKNLFEMLVVQSGETSTDFESCIAENLLIDETKMNSTDTTKNELKTEFNDAIKENEFDDGSTINSKMETFDNLLTSVKPKDKVLTTNTLNMCRENTTSAQFVDESISSTALRSRNAKTKIKGSVKEIDKSFKSSSEKKISNFKAPEITQPAIVKRMAATQKVGSAIGLATPTQNVNYVKPVNLPSLGLRLGLSRKAAIKPLHSTLKLPS